jgi:hypothetical protein
MVDAGLARRTKTLAHARKARGDRLPDNAAADATSLAVVWVTVAANRGYTVGDLERAGDICALALDTVVIADRRRRGIRLFDHGPAVERVVEASGDGE